MILVGHSTALAHLDTLTQVLEPDPLVKSFEAENLPRLGAGKVIEDNAATGGQAVALGESDGFKLSLGTLPVGIHCLYVCAKVTEPNVVVDGPKTREVKPLYFHLKVNSAPGGGIEEHRLRVPIHEKGLYENLARIYFHTPEERTYQAEVFLGPRGMIQSAVVDRIELRNPLSGLTFQALKTRPMLYTPGEIEQLKATAAKEGKVHPPIRSGALSPEQRKTRDDIIWNSSLMPINANCANYYLLSLVSPKAGEHFAKVVAAREKASGKSLGRWENVHGNAHPYDEPWALTNKTLALGYTMADYNAGRPLPSPWPFPEDRGGFFYEKDKWGVEVSFNHAIIPQQIGNHQAAIMKALCPGEGDPSLGLPDRYLLGGDREAAADGAFLLAALAYRFPGYDYKLHAAEHIFYEGSAFKPGSGYGRGPAGQWSGAEYVRLCYAYDKLFSYIQGNADLAARLGRFVPWVKTPDDVVRLIDTFLIQRGAQDGVQHVFYAQTVMPISAVVLGPNPVSERILDTYLQKVYLRNTLCGFLDSVVGGYSRDGLNYIGSTYYVPFESKDELFEVADLLSRYVQSGGDQRFDVGDPNRFPQLTAQADSILRLHVAGGYTAGVGDVGGPQLPPKLSFAKDWGSSFLRSWRWTKDPRLAWVLVNVMGQGTCPNAEWQEIVNVARTQRDPIRHATSHVLEGYGIAALEEGSESGDLRHKNTVMLRFGVASGHAHPDTLDLEVYAHGLRMSSDLGGRIFGKYGRPSCMSSFVHNVVEVDEKDFCGGPQNSTATGWLDAFKPLPGAQFVMGSARAETHPHVSRYTRGALQVMCDAGNGKDITPSGYVFDVFRVRGGKVHTWCFHGCVSEEFACNAGLKSAESEVATRYLREHLKGSAKEGAAPDVLEATWKLRRKEETVDGIKLNNAEKTMLGDLYDPGAPEKSTRVRLFGHAGDRVLVGNWYANQMESRLHNFPFLYVRRDGKYALDSVYAALIEPFAGKPFIEAARQLNIGNADGAVALEVKTTFGQTDFLFSSLDGQRTYPVAGWGSASGTAALVSRDGQGLRLLALIGGTELSVGDVSVKLKKAEYRSEIKSADYRQRRLTLAEPFPAKLLDGEMVRIGNARHTTTYKATRMDGTLVQMDRGSAVYRGGVERLEPQDGYAELDLAPYLHSYHPDYYEGTTAANEEGTVLGKVSVKLGDRFFYTGWPAARRHLNTINPKDITDANGDGKVTVAMIATDKQRKFAADGTTIIETKPGEKMLDLEVTRVRDDGLMIFTRQHPRQYLDSAEVAHPGWPYDQQIIRNERGDKQWTVNMPGDTYQLHVEGRKLVPSDFPDADRDGRSTVVFHDYGPGDQVVVPGHCHLRRIGPGVLELRANVGCMLTLPARSVSISNDNGRNWGRVSAPVTDGRITFTLREADLGTGHVLLKLGG